VRLRDGTNKEWACLPLVRGANKDNNLTCGVHSNPVHGERKTLPSNKLADGEHKAPHRSNSNPMHGERKVPHRSNQLGGEIKAQEVWVDSSP